MAVRTDLFVRLIDQSDGFVLRQRWNLNLHLDRNAEASPLARPLEVWQVTTAPLTSFLCCRATNSIAPPKQAAYPAANKCSGVVVSGNPGPPISFRTDKLTLTE